MRGLRDVAFFYAGFTLGISLCWARVVRLARQVKLLRRRVLEKKQ